MIRYSRGLRKKVRTARALARWTATQAIGVLRSWPVHRPPIDHAVYAVDNEALPSTTRSRARIVHQVSMDRPVECSRAIVEFEHPTALVGHIGIDTDYRTFRESFPARMKTLARWYDPRRHRLVGASSTATQALAETAARLGFPLEPTGLRTLRWAMPLARDEVRPLAGRLVVFHYGGGWPYAKGTHDVLRAARLLPEARFLICADLSHELWTRGIPRNVEVIPHTDRRRYLEAIGSSHVLANPIYSDGWGVILDATARAMPVVTHATWDKAEAVEPGITGELIQVPAERSLYEGFDLGRWHSWAEFNSFLREAGDTGPAEELASALAGYAADRDRLREHSRATARRHLERHDPAARLRAIHALYAELS